VPKCEIFDRSDFDDFYTITSLCEGDFGVKIKGDFFCKFGPKNFFSVELLRPLVSVNIDFFKIFHF
jgi:hypothetical protein